MSKKTHKKSSSQNQGAKRPTTGAAKAKKAAPKTAKKAATSKATVKKAPPKKASGTSKAGARPAPSGGKAKAPQQTPLAEGKSAPAFSLPRDGGTSVSLADYAGRKLVIFFYPRADTPGCTLEAIAFSRLADKFEAAGTAILGVSADPVAKQDAFRDKHDLTVPLASDEALDMLKSYGVWGEKSMYGKTFMGISRTTVLVDAKGQIARVWHNVKVEGHADDVLAAARSL